ncbi:MAG: hypothetical protein ACMXYL_00380 [Candidatus Woesearchaeota archaeon]
MVEGLIWKTVALIFTAIPLYIAVRILGGKSSFVNAMLVNVVSGILTSQMRLQYGLWGMILGFFFTLWLYREVFRLIWIKAFLVFIVQAVVLVILYFILLVLSMITGIALLAFFV